MRSAFFEFNVARSALFLARGGLDVVNHNVANHRLDAGFSRQFIEQRATSPMTFRDSRGMIGTGTEIFGIGQHRNFYLDRKYWNERSTLGRFQMQSQQLRVLEMGLNEMRGTGTTAGFGLFFDTIQNLSTSASDEVFRTNVVQAANGLATFIHSMSQTMRRQQIDANEEVAIMVGRINSLGNQIASLNEQIARTELTGSRANDLRDARARLIDELSLYVNVEVREIERNEDFAAGLFPEPEQRGRSMLHFSVMINGREFVSGRDANLLEVVPRSPGAERNPTDVPGLFDIRFRGGMGFDIYSPTLRGQLRGLIEVRDGNNGAHVNARAADITFPAAPPAGAPAGSTWMTIANPSRDDLNPTGRITIINDVGRAIEIHYRDLRENTDGSITIEIGQDLDGVWTQGIPANFTGDIARIEIGRTTNFKGIPHYQNKFNELVRTFTMAINHGQRKDGQMIPDAFAREDRDFNHIINAGAIGDLYQEARRHYALFGFDNPDQITNAMAGMNAQERLEWFVDNNFLDLFIYNKDDRSNALLDFAVNPILQQNPTWMATNSNNPIGESKNDVVFGFVAVSNYRGLFAEGRISDFIVAMSGELGIDIRMAMRFESNYHDIVQSVDIQRMSIMGVDINEEMANMMRFQHIYQAAAALVNAIDGLYDMTINRLGVGF